MIHLLAAKLNHLRYHPHHNRYRHSPQTQMTEQKVAPPQQVELHSQVEVR